MTTVPGRFGSTVLGVLLLPVTRVAAADRRTGPGPDGRGAPGARAAHRRLVEEAARLAQTRRRVVDAQAAELRRIERDLHDGAQARIVAAGMTLALAARKLRTGAAAASDLDRAAGSSTTPSPSCAGWYAASTRRSSPTGGCTPPSRPGRRQPARRRDPAATRPTGTRRRSSPRPTSSSPRASPTRASTPSARTCVVTLARAAGTVTVTLTDDGRAAPTRPAPGSTACAAASRHSTAGSPSPVHPAVPPSCPRSCPMMRIVIAEDLLLLREGMVRLLDRHRPHRRRRRRHRTRPAGGRHRAPTRPVASWTFDCRPASATRGSAAL